MRAWIAEEYGKPSSVLALRELPPPSPGAEEIGVAVEAATVNMNEIDMIYGRYASVPVRPPFVPGIEVVGVVEALGEGVPEGWLGKRVVGMPTGGTGGYAERAILPRTMAFEIPDEMPLDQAAAHFWPFHLAWLCLFDRGGLQAGETVLVHAGAGGAGSAAIQLAANAGARVIATAGSDEKASICGELGATVAVNYRSADFVTAVLDATGGQGVDVAFDGVGGEVTEQTWRCLAYGARHVVFGFSSGIEQVDERPISLRETIYGNFSLVGALLTYVDDEDLLPQHGVDYPPININYPKRSLGATIEGELLELFAAGKIRAVVYRTVEFEEVPTALDAFENRETVGRVIVRAADRSPRREPEEVAA